jgi:phage pi2 protein 07
LYASTTKNGIIVSYDKGKTWDENISMKYPISWLYHFEDKLVGYFGFRKTYIVVSEDKGKTWAEVSTDTLFLNVSHSIYSLTYNEGDIYIANGKGIYKTTNKGENWQLVSTKFGYRARIVFFKGRLYACDNEQGMFSSSDFGKTWQAEPFRHLSMIFRRYGDQLLTQEEGFVYYLKDPKEGWQMLFNEKMGELPRIERFCCEGYFFPDYRIVFPSDYSFNIPDFLLPNAIQCNCSNIVVGVVNNGIWYLDYYVELKYN